MVGRGPEPVSHLPSAGRASSILVTRSTICSPGQTAFTVGLAIAADPCASLEPLRESAGVLDLDDYLPALAAAVAAPKCSQRFGEREDRVDVHAQLVCIGQPSHLG